MKFPHLSGAERPERCVREQFLVATQEPGGRADPMHGVDRAADDQRVIGLEVIDVLDLDAVDIEFVSA